LSGEVGSQFPRDLVWECDAVPSQSEVLQELAFAGFGLGMRCCSLAQRGPTGLGFRGICSGNAMLFPRTARSYRNWISRDLFWECDAVPSRSEVLQGQNVGPRFPRDLVWGCNAVPSRSEVLQGLVFRGIWFGSAVLFPRKVRSYRAWLSRDLFWECDAVPSHSEVLQRQNVGPRFPRDLIWDCDAVPSRSEVLQGLVFCGIWFGVAMQLPRAARSYKGNCRTAVSAGFGLGLQCSSLAQRGRTRAIVGPRFPRDLIWDCDAVPSRSEVLLNRNPKHGY